MALARRSTRGLGRRCDQWLPISLQNKRYLPAAWELLRTWKREELPLQAPPLTGPIVFALSATARAWNLTDVALIIAVSNGGFLRTMEALTLQRSHITAHSSCVLLTLPITKPENALEINRLLCLLCPSDYLLQQSPHSFRAIFTALLSALELGSFHFSPYSLRRGGATDAFFLETWMRPLRERSLVFCEDRTHLLKCKHNTSNEPFSPHSVVKYARSTSVRQLIQKIENHPDRHALQKDLRQNQSFNPFSPESKHMIRDVGNIELCELLQTEPKTQCTVCLSYWNIGILYCTCGHFLH